MIALPKGKRLVRKSYEVFSSIGYISTELEEELKNAQGKRLEFTTDDKSVVYLLARASDIPQYIDKNWADLGVSAFDCYREYELANIAKSGSMRGDNFSSDIFQDLKLCPTARFCVAGKPEQLKNYKKSIESNEKILSVASTCPHIAMNYFTKKGMTVDIITIAGSSEIMPRYAEVDAIFDIVETGSALSENGLVIFEEAYKIETKILASKAAIKYDQNVLRMIERLREVYA
ncbi:MAG: ATP phosphoribosyltransferase [Clostridiales bacterium]|nr:ATP phosphoribosyltransferase [Clostridiales bacterium]